MTSRIEPLSLSGCTLRGPLHTCRGLPNQDAFLCRSFHRGAVAAVADGLGSQRLSHIGAQAACGCVAEAVKLWSRFPACGGDQLIPLICSLWDIHTCPLEAEQCGSTCLFAAALRPDRLVLGQVGDGLILYEVNGQIGVLREKEDAFLNLTTPLYVARDPKKWSYREFALDGSGFTVCLMTDGISAALAEGMEGPLLQALAEDLRCRRTDSQRNRVLRQMLEAWDRPTGDDMTIVVMEGGRQYG